MTKEHQLGYIQSVLCLMKLPPKDKSRPDPKSRFEEFQATHIYLTDRVHSVVCMVLNRFVPLGNSSIQGHFLPWHRHLGTLYANALRDECGYKGPIAWVLSLIFDVSSIVSTPYCLDFGIGLEMQTIDLSRKFSRHRLTNTVLTQPHSAASRTLPSLTRSMASVVTVFQGHTPFHPTLLEIMP